MNSESKIIFHEILKSDSVVYNPSLHYAYTRSLFKTASLFFDRIYIDMFDWSTLKYSIDESTPEKFFYVNQEITGAISHHMDVLSPDSPFPIYGNLDFAFARGVLIESKKRGITLTPIYGSVIKGEKWGDVDCEGLNTNALRVSLSGFPNVSENDLSWDQIVEFRNDKVALKRLQATRALLTELRECKTEAQAIEKTEELMDKYMDACKKHGITLYSSLFDQIYDKDTLIATASVALLTGSLSASIAAGVIKFAKDCVVTIDSLKRSKDEMEITHRSGAAALSLRRL